MALTPVNRHLGLFGLLMPLLGCADGVELLSSNEQSGFGGVFAAGGEPTGAANAGGVAPPETASGGKGELGGAPTAVSGGVAGTGAPTFGGTENRGGGGSGGTSSGNAGSGGGCAVDGDCVYASERCESGACVPCDGQLPACEHGWSARVFSRNGCMQFSCAPPSGCHSSADCGGTETCYAGETCEEGCAAGDPRCCEGNFCAAPGCDAAAVPLSCTERGCPLGQRCVGPEWTPPDCDCVSGAWVCRSAPAASQCE